MIGKSSIQRYILYAVGEIALVVVGILLALQINNWSESQKDRELEMHLLNEISGTLEDNINSLGSIILELEEKITSNQIVLSVLDNQSEFADTLAEHFFRASWLEVTRLTAALSNEGYEYLKNQGFELIQNTDLRKTIIRIFEKDIPVYVSGSTTYENRSYHSVERLRELFYGTQVGIDDPVEWYPFDHKVTLKDKYYYSMINGFFTFRKIHLNRSKELKTVIEELHQEVQTELGNQY